MKLAQHRRSGGRFRGLLGTAAGLLIVAALVAPSQASAQGTGFTGDFWYWNQPTCIGCTQYSPEAHSYGFNSATNTSQSAVGYVGSEIWNNAVGLAASAYGYNLARACVHGTYPNCVDTDGWSGQGGVANRSNVVLRIKGHGVF